MMDAASPLDPGAPLMDLGLNSLQAVLLMRSLSDELGTALPAIMPFDHPTVLRLAGAIDTQLSGRVAATPHTRTPHRPTARSCHRGPRPRATR